MDECDVIVIGLGPGGSDLAERLAKAGLSVVGVEKHLIGGECRYYGCTPSKMLIRATEAVTEGKRAADLSDLSSGVGHWRPIAARIAREGAGGWRDDDNAHGLDEAGIRVVRGEGRLTGDRTVAVGEQEFRARRGVVIATGTSPSIPDVPGLAEIRPMTNRDVFKMEWLPSRLLCLGGGVIGIELTQALARLGVAVTMVEPADRIASNEEPETSRLLADALRADGVEVFEGVDVESVSRAGNEVTARLSTGRKATFDAVLVAAGRQTGLSVLGLDTIGLPSDAAFLETDDRLQVADGLWAIGDVTGEGLYTHVAHYQAEIAAAAILDAASAPHADYRAVPRVVFADPEIGAVGLTEAAARQEGRAVKTACTGLDSSTRAWLHGPGADGFVKLVADPAAGQLIGATLAGPDASETVPLLTLAIHARVPLDRLQSMIYGFPSFNDAVKKAVDKLRDH